MNILLSIITINKNNAQCLRRTLDSLRMALDCPFVECYFLDGKSVDNSVEIASDYYRPSNIIVDSDSGIYDAMNKGLYLSKGRYVLWLNSGDVLNSLSLAKILDVLHDETSDLVFGVADIKTVDGFHEAVWTPRMDMLKSKKLPCHQATFFKREKFIEKGGYDISYKILADYKAVYRMLQNDCSFRIINLKICDFYKGGVSQSHKGYFEYWRMQKELNLISSSQYIKGNLISFLKLVYVIIKKRCAAT